MADHDDLLVRALRELGGGLDTGPVPDVVPAVLARVAGTLPDRGLGRLLLSRAGRRVRALLGAVLVAVLAAVPAVREAAADVVGAVIALPGVVVRAGDPPASAPAPTLAGTRSAAGPLGQELGYTRAPMPLAEARGLGAPVVRLPAGLGPPDEVYVLGPGGRAVSLLWRERPGLPALPGSRIGLIVDTVTPADGPLLEKYIGTQAVERVQVGGRPAVWVGGPHELVPIGDDGWPRYDSRRTARGTLLVALPGGTVRIESGLPRDAVMRLAATLASPG